MRHSFFGSFLCLNQLLGILLSSRDNHGLFKIILLGREGILIGEAHLMVTDSNYVTVLQRMFLDQLPVDVCTVGTVEIFKEGVVQDIDDQRVVAADCRIIDPDIIVRQAPDCVALFRHVVFSKDLIVQT